MASDSTSPPAEDASSGPRLGPGGGPFRRLQSHAQGLADDVRAWLEMRFELAKIELYERLDDQLDQLVLYAIVGGLGAVGGFVMLLATCFGASWIISALTGWTIGALFLGFLAVALFFLLGAGIILAAEPRFGLLKDKTRAVFPERRVMEGRAAGERTRAPDADRDRRGEA
jgi:hypothetical protein